MLARVQNAKIGVKLPLVIGGLVALTITVMAGANAYLTSQIITQNAQEKLQSIAFINNKRISSLLESIDRDIRLQADAPATSVALIALAAGLFALWATGSFATWATPANSGAPSGPSSAVVVSDPGQAASTASFLEG